jgi:hypothetical protein
MWIVIAASVKETMPFFLSALAGALFLLLFLIPYRRPLWSSLRSGDVAQDFGFIFFACLLGTIIGVSAGYSREAAIGAIVPAVLTLIGIMIGYIYSGAAKLTRVNRLAILLATMGMIAFFFWGEFAGSWLRAPLERYKYDIEVYKHQAEMQRLEYQAALELNKLENKAELEKYMLHYKADLEGNKTGPSRTPK